jgi:Mrp family chromosome partitioning ATPase
VATRLAETALARGGNATVLDLTGQGPAAVAGMSARTVITRAEENASFVVVRLPGISAEATAAVLSHSRPVLLVAPSARVDRRALSEIVDTLKRLDVPCAGVVLAESPNGVIV